MLVQRPAFDQCPEMLFERVATGAGQFDRLANGDAAVLAGELDDLYSARSRFPASGRAHGKWLCSAALPIMKFQDGS